MITINDNYIFIILITEKSSPPIDFSITKIGINSFQLRWMPPVNPHGTINRYVVSYTQPVTVSIP